MAADGGAISSFDALHAQLLAWQKQHGRTLQAVAAHIAGDANDDLGDIGYSILSLEQGHVSNVDSKAMLYCDVVNLAVVLDMARGDAAYGDWVAPHIKPNFFNGGAKKPTALNPIGEAYYSLYTQPDAGLRAIESGINALYVLANAPDAYGVSEHAENIRDAADSAAGVFSQQANVDAAYDILRRSYENQAHKGQKTQKDGAPSRNATKAKLHLTGERPAVFAMPDVSRDDEPRGAVMSASLEGVFDAKAEGIQRSD